MSAVFWFKSVETVCEREFQVAVHGVRFHSVVLCGEFYSEFWIACIEDVAGIDGKFTASFFPELAILHRHLFSIMGQSIQALGFVLL